MKKNVLDIKQQSLAQALVAPFNICRSCHIVDQDINRSLIGFACPVCGRAGNGGLMYFELSIHTLVNLMQEAIHAKNRLQENLIEADSHDISVVLFFCTLREILLNHIIFELCLALNIPLGVYDRLLADNMTHTQRQNNLLPSLIEKKWDRLVREEIDLGNIDGIGLNVFLKKAVEARNKFMHEGEKWDIDRALAENCIRNIQPLLNFYVALHNKYVHPIFLEKMSNPDIP